MCFLILSNANSCVPSECEFDVDGLKNIKIDDKVIHTHIYVLYYIKNLMQFCRHSRSSSIELISNSCTGIGTGGLNTSAVRI